jgi:hypothetical protein
MTALAAVSAFSGQARAADPTTADCIAASEASIREGNAHRLRAARSQLLVCAASTCPADIRKECLRRVDEVNKEIPTIIFETKDGSGKELIDVRVKMDGEILAERLEGTALSIDPGQHTFTFEPAGRAPLQAKLVIHEGEKDRREPLVVPAAPVPDRGQGATQVQGTGEGGLWGNRTRPPGPGLGTQRILALAAGGVGVVGVALGVVFAASMLSKQSDAQAVCPNDPCPTQDGVDKWNAVSSASTASTIAFVVGGVGLAAGAILWFTAKPEARAGATALGVGPGSLQFKTTW